MALLIIAPELESEMFADELQRLDPDLDVRIWPQTGNADDIELALTWHHPIGEFAKFKKLKCIASLGAGVDHIFRDSELPEGVPVTRVVQSSMSQFMSEYVILAVLHYCRQFDIYKDDQAAKRWHSRIPLLARDICIGIMGLGQLGADAARKLAQLEFNVAGWSRTPKTIDGVESYAGNDALGEFLSRANILVCLLPLTPATTGILNSSTFEKLPAGAYIINVARGAHLIEDDLLAALDSGHLSGACLDVFQTEPLPEDHPFWSHPKILITPHISSITDPISVMPQILENYRRMKSGKPLTHVVDIDRGY
ncbi:MAG: glyoxylate/hydroxypyruvate reductase A [Deltaproteobacteria bacterium]|nr:glyoxylate/hydroxypyruvate reductase A [Deltaproteobacteria bacterium]